MAVVEYEEIHQPNWLERMSGSFKGVLTGLGLIVGGVALLFWNEGRAVKTATALEQGSGAVVSVSADKVDPANEGKLVHVSGKADTKEVLEDSLLGVKVTAIKLKRTVEIYQWVENEKTRTVKKGDKTYKETTYSYEKRWCKDPVSSSAFKEAGHDNPAVTKIASDSELSANDVTLGAFNLSEANIRRIQGLADYEFPADYKLPAALTNAQLENNTVYVAGPLQKTASAGMSPLLAAAQNSASNAVNAAVRNVAAGPLVGDQRIRLRVVLPHDISLCQKQMGKTFAGWTAGNGKTISLQEEGLKAAEEMFANAQHSNMVMTWLLRAAGFLLLFFGWRGVFGPIATLVDVIPLLNGLVSMGVGLVSALLSAVIWLISVAIAWIFYRPVLGVSLLVAAGVLIVVILMKKKTPAA